MELTVNREAALGAATFARNSAMRRSTIPILGCVRIAAAEDRITFTGTDLDMEAAKSCAAAVTAPGDLAVSADRLVGAIQSLPTGSEVAINLDASASRLVVKCGRARFQIPTFPSAEFPSFAADEDASSADIASADLIRLLDATEFAVGREQTRPYITGVRAHVIDGKLRFVATNGTALSLEEIDCPPELSSYAGQSIPLKATAILRAIAAGADTVNIRPGARLFCATTDTSRLAAKVIDQDFPNYLRVIPTDLTGECLISRTSLAEAVARCMTTTDARVPAVRLSLADSVVTISVRGEFGEDATDAFEADATDAFEGLFDGRLLVAIMGRFATPNVLFRFKDSVSPVTFSEPGAEGSLSVLIGMRMT